MQIEIGFIMANGLLNSTKITDCFVFFTFFVAPLERDTSLTHVHKEVIIFVLMA